MNIIQFDRRDRKNRKAFIEFPFKLYKDNPYFCPQLESGARGALDRSRHPFYKHSSADFFLAESEGDVIGRIAAVHNTHHNEYRKVRTAFFWSFDAVDDFQVAQRLVEAVFVVS